MNFPFLELKKVEKDLGDVPGVQGLVLLAHKALDRIQDLEMELRLKNTITYGTSHPEIYKSELDDIKDRYQELRRLAIDVLDVNDRASHRVLRAFFTRGEK